MNDKIKFKEKYYFKRMTKTFWNQTNKDNIANAKYNQPFRAANALFVGIISKN